MAKIIFTITPTGEVTSDVVGATGKSCVELTAPYERHFGKAEERQFKPEYYAQQDEARTTIKNEKKQ